MIQFGLLVAHRVEQGALRLTGAIEHHGAKSVAVFLSQTSNQLREGCIRLDDDRLARHPRGALQLREVVHRHLHGVIVKLVATSGPLVDPQASRLWPRFGYCWRGPFSSAITSMPHKMVVRLLAVA